MKVKKSLISDEEMKLIKQERQKVYNKKCYDDVTSSYRENVDKVIKKFWLSELQIKKLLLTNTFTEILNWKIVNWELVINNLYNVDKRNII